MQDNDNIITYKDREYLRFFFLSVYEWLLNHLNPSHDDLIEFTLLYKEFLKKNKLNNNKTLKLFLQELNEEIAQNTINQNHDIYINYLYNTPLLIHNKVILKWYRESKLERRIFNSAPSLQRVK